MTSLARARGPSPRTRSVNTTNNNKLKCGQTARTKDTQMIANIAKSALWDSTSGGSKSSPLLVLDTNVKRWLCTLHISILATMADTNIPRNKVETKRVKSGHNQIGNQMTLGSGVAVVMLEMVALTNPGMGNPGIWVEDRVILLLHVGLERLVNFSSRLIGL